MRILRHLLVNPDYTLSPQLSDIMLKVFSRPALLFGQQPSRNEAVFAGYVEKSRQVVIQFYGDCTNVGFVNYRSVTQDICLLQSTDHVVSENKTESTLIFDFSLFYDMLSECQ